jgi:hypothetical protein
MLIANNEGAFNGGEIEFGTLEEALTFATRQSDAYAAYVRSTFLAPASPYEAASWSLKLAEAQGHGISPTPMLDIEAQARGITTADLVTKIISKAQALAGLEAVISGTNGRHNDAIKLLTDIEEVKAYDWRGGYPDVAD